MFAGNDVIAISSLGGASGYFRLWILKGRPRLYITCSAVTLSRVLRTALVPYGNMESSTPHSTETSQVITMKLCTFDNVRKTNTCAKFG